MWLIYHCYCMPLHYAMGRTQLTSMEYQQSSMQCHLQAPQGNCNEDLTSLNFPSKATRKRQKSHDHRQLIVVSCPPLNPES